jgi:hypothetical protein
MPSDGDSYVYEVSFTVSPGSKTGQITVLRSDRIFYGNKSEDVAFKVRADSDEEAEEKAFKMLTDPNGEYVKKYGPAFEVKRKHVWRVYY